MHHGVDAGGGGHVGRQAQGQVGIQQRQVGQQNGGDHAHLGGGAGGDDGDLGHFRAGAGRGWHLNQRQALAAGVAHAIDVLQALRAVGVCEQGNQLGHVHRAAATKTDDQLRLHGFGLLNGGQHHGLRRVCFYLIEYFGGNLRLGQGRQYVIEQADLGDAGVGNDKHAVGIAQLAQLAQLGGGAGFAKDLRGGSKAEGIHRASGWGVCSACQGRRGGTCCCSGVAVHKSRHVARFIQTEPILLTVRSCGKGY